MPETLFDRASAALESASEFDKLTARGTLRLALKQAGLDPRGVTKEQMTVVLEKVIPLELESRGIDGTDGVCEAMIASVQSFEGDESPDETPEAVFSRLGG